MTRTSEGLAAFVVDQLEELYRRMWVLRLLDMALEQLRIEGLINGPLQGGFGQEAVSVGAAAALGEGDVIITTHRPHAQHVGTDAPLGPVIADMLGATAGDLEGADEDAHIADPRAGLPAAIRVVKQSPLLAIGHAYALWLRDTGRVTLCVTQDCDVDADAFNEAAAMPAPRKPRRLNRLLSKALPLVASSGIDRSSSGFGLALRTLPRHRAVRNG